MPGNGCDGPPGDGAASTAPDPVAAGEKPGIYNHRHACADLRKHSVDQQRAGKDQMLPVPVGRIVAGFPRETRRPVPGLVPVPHLDQVFRNRPAAGQHAGDQRRHVAGLARARRRRVPSVIFWVKQRQRRTGGAYHGRAHPVEQHPQTISGSRRAGRENAVTKILER